MVYSSGRMVYDTKEQVIESIKSSKSLRLNIIIIGITVVGVMFMTLCACNNTFWHLPYLFAY